MFRVSDEAIVCEVYTCPIDSVRTEIKGTVLIQSPKAGVDKFLSWRRKYARKRNRRRWPQSHRLWWQDWLSLSALSQQIRYYGVCLQSRFDIRLCKAINATALPHLVNLHYEIHFIYEI